MNHTSQNSQKFQPGKYRHLLNVKSNENALVLLSGGMDSTVALYLAKKVKLNVSALEFNYRGRPAVEMERNKQICTAANVDLYRIEYPGIVKENQTGNSHNEYCIEESNGVYYILAASCANIIRAKYIIGGQIILDWKNCDVGQASPDYYQCLNDLLRKEYGESTPKIIMPFLYLEKIQVAAIGMELNVPFELTWSCPNSSTVPCNQCPQCKERQETLEIIGWKEKK